MGTSLWSYTMVMKRAKFKTVPAGVFKAQCLHLMDEVQETGVSLVVTKRGKPVVKLVPATPEAKPFRSLYGRTKGSMTILGDIISPLPNEWEADQD
jgi:prevent-host-death family protein